MAYFHQAPCIKKFSRFLLFSWLAVRMRIRGLFR